MADDGFNSMQAQLGLVGGSSSFNPLGIATPAPPPPPMVRHPGEVSRDIVQQTQTQMATTMQTTAAMRMGGMGGVAFGGGGMGGGGIGAIGAFAQQYQQNMQGINAQHIAPFSAQMMGMMGGMGGGFNPGMMPHPAMMTTPGMGIYRPFPQQAGPTVSPFPQMPMFQTPFTPMPPPPQFQTPMELSNNMAIQAGQRRTAGMFALPGVMARGGADIGFGAMGAGLGASLGARFGPMGALIGGGLGMAAGAFGSEHMGLGATAQHITDSLNPFRTMAIRGQQMMGASQGWVSGGTDLNMTGRGLSSSGATHLGRMLEDTAFSSRFRRETGGAFSAQDMTKITNVAGQQGMLNDAQSVDQIHDRVKGIAKSLVSFMKIANEPNVVEALKSMGKMRAMGLSVAETMDAAVDARMFSRMAGTTAKGLMESGGMPGAMLFQQQGLSAGLGMRMGMGAMGMAGAAVSGGAFSPQRLAMLGGVQGVAQHEMESSAAFLKMPMMAAAMSRMGPGGEFNVDGAAIKSMRGGGVNIGGMATMGANNLLEAVRKQGVGALGMMQVQGTEIQDSIGRLLGPQGLQAAKMNQVMQTMGMMGLDKNQGGFATAALSMGMSNDQVKSMMGQAGSPGYWRNMQAQNRVQQMEMRGMASDEADRNRPGFMGRMMRGGSGEFGMATGDAYRGFRNMGEGISDYFAEGAQDSQAASQGQVVLRTNRSLLASTDDQLRRGRAVRGEERALAEATLTQMGNEYGRGRDRDRNRGFITGGANNVDAMLGGDAGDRMQLRRAQGGLAGALGGGALESTARFGLGVVNEMASWVGGVGGREAMDAVFGSEGEHRAQTADLQAGSDMWSGGMNLGAEGKGNLLAATAKSSGLSKEKLNQIITKASFSLGEKGRARLKVIGQEALMGGAEGKAAIRQAAKDAGVDPDTLSDETISNIGKAGRDEFEAMSGGNKKAFTAVDFVNVKSHKEFVDKAQEKQDALTSALFGKEGEGMDLMRGTRNRRADMTAKLFAGSTSPKAAILAMLREAAHSTPEAQAAFERENATASDDEKEEGLRVSERFTEEERADLDAGGRRLATLAPEEVGGAMRAARTNDVVLRGQANTRAGKRLMFGEGVNETASMGELLGGKTGKMTGRMKELANAYQVAQGKGDKAEMARLEEEASDEVASQGTAMANETAGGAEAITDSMYKDRAKTMADAEKNVSGAFPHAVETFSSASKAMLKAAQLLGQRGDVTGLPPDANLVGR